MMTSNVIKPVAVLMMILGQAAHAQHQHSHDHAEHTDEVHLTAEAITRHGITLEPVKRHTLRPTFVAPARVSFNTDAMAHVGSALRGRIVELKAKVGDQVKKGDELLIIESPELAEAQSDFLLKRTEADIAVVAVEPAKQAYERAKSLHEKDQGVALAEVQKREAEWRAADGRLIAAKAAAVAAENKLHALGMDQSAVEALAKTSEVNVRAAIRAPMPGQVIQREVTLGELVNPDRDALLVLADLTTLWVIADAPEARLGDVAVGSRARIELAAIARQKLEGKVTHIAASLNAQTRTASIRIEVTNPGPLRAGMFARAEIEGSENDGTRDVLAIPEAAVLTVEGEPCVFTPVEGEENTFAKTPVKVGRSVGGLLPVLDGLKEGQPIVVAGTFILKAELGKSGAEHHH
jgi:cobalt-zinc-cadmium efflux system membrane fusion protein